MDNIAERALDLIRRRGTLRDPQLAVALGSDEASVAAALAPHCDSGELVRCSVALVGKGDVNEYRISAAGPRKAGDAYLKKPATPPEQVLAAAAAAKAATVRTAHSTRVTPPNTHITEAPCLSRNASSRYTPSTAR